MSKCVVTEPSSFEEAVEDPAWVDAMVEEYDSIVRNSAWEIVPRPEGKSVVGSRWIYKVKQAADGSVEKYKARFVARGFSQIEGNDYEETFAPCRKVFFHADDSYSLSADGMAHSSDGCEDCIPQWSR